MQEQLPGVSPILHQGKISGAFDLLASDMAQVEYEGRVVLVLVADVDQVTVKTVRGDQTAFWTFKGADAAIVRDPDMRERLAETLHLDSVHSPLKLTDFLDGDVTHGTTLEGVYDDEGAFLGFEEADKPPPPAVDVETGEILDEEEDSVPVRRTKPKDPRPKGEMFVPGTAPHIRHRDPALEKFLNEPANA